MTGIQAIERTHPSLPVKPGSVERIEFEYIRHGTQSLIASFEVATGKIICSTVGDTRTECDFSMHILNMLETNPKARWVIVADQLNTHQSKTLVTLVSWFCDIAKEKYLKDEVNIMKSMESRKEFLSNPAHRVRFLYTPKHTSWMNQIEIWFSILVRRLLKRSSFTSKNDLKKRILDFIDYFNKTLAKPFEWTYKGKVLKA